MSTTCLPDGGFLPLADGSACGARAQSPLRPGWDRILQVGDASGIQSPLSFGGFGALTRHLGRLRAALSDALQVGRRVLGAWPCACLGSGIPCGFFLCASAAAVGTSGGRASVVPMLQADALDRQALGAVNAYNPGVSGAWMLQRAMSVRAGAERVDPAFINSLLANNFAAMQKFGDPVLKPFLQAGRPGSPPAALPSRQGSACVHATTIVGVGGPCRRAPFCLFRHYGHAHPQGVIGATHAWGRRMWCSSLRSR